LKYLFLILLAFTTMFADEQYLDDGIEIQMTDDGVQQQISTLMDSAFNMMGVRYRFGATGEESTDCSNFTRQSYKGIGIELPRTAAEQAHLGIKVAKEDLKVGDLLFFKTRGRKIGHVGMYIGDGKMIHASFRLREVVIDSLDKAYYVKRFVTAKRIFGL
jgi:cell wall-associated NlpC family hydrolase